MSGARDFIWPFSASETITFIRGVQRNANGDIIHNGIDYSAVTGTNIMASGTGLVVIVDYCSISPTCIGQAGNTSSSGNGGFGNVIIIEYGYDSLPDEVRTEYNLETGRSLYVLYAHLSTINVKRGDIVHSGDVVGQVGNTGNSGGSHLHIQFHTGTSGRIWAPSLCHGGTPRCTGQATWTIWYGLNIDNDPELLWPRPALE